ncbi:phosphohydrolase [Clostridium beijerinckii]|nr:phosphohydrolase [Clostridium beijerinckii]
MKENFEVTLKQVILIIHRTINSVDKRLLNHGEQVAYIMMNLLKADGSYSDEEILEICAVSVFHDIGAYKVTEIDKLVEVDTRKPIEHAIYGALFIKYFSPLSDLYKIVLTHHFTFKYFEDKHMNVMCKEGLLLNFADYIDRVYLNKKSFNKGNFEDDKGNYLKKHIDLFVEADRKFDFVSKIVNGTFEDELYSFFETKIINREEVISYSKMLAYSIDFRSEATVKHTITVEAISYQIAKICGLDEEKLTRIRIASVLHDIGKIGIPVEILEKPGKVSHEEFEIIKSHAMIGYNILSELNIDDIRNVATLHHEKLDGSGYPFGLKAEQLSTEIRIIAIADIISALIGVRSYKGIFSKDKTINILLDMVNNNKIDGSITNLFINNYDYLIKEAEIQCRELMNIYLNLNNEFNELLEQLA